MEAVTSTRTLTVAVLVLGAMLFSVWLLAPIFDADSRSISDYVSELAAADQPHSMLFRSADFACGAFVLVGAACGIAAAPRCSLIMIGWWALALFAVSTAADAVLPLSCAPSADAACAAAEAAGSVPLSHRLHVVSSTLAVAGAVVSLPIFALAAHRAATPGTLPLTGLVLTAVLWVSTSVSVVVIGIDERGNAATIGVAQRLQLLAIAGWLLYVAAFVRHGAEPPHRTRRARPQP